VGEDGFVGEDAVKGGTADSQLTGGAELVAAVEIEDRFDVVSDYGVEGEGFGLERGLLPGLRSETWGTRRVTWGA
jgi:hypothetical protein